MPILVAIMGALTVREESQSLKWLQIPVLGNSRVRLDLSCIGSTFISNICKKSNKPKSTRNVLGSQTLEKVYSLKLKCIWASSRIFQIYLKETGAMVPYSQQANQRQSGGCWRGFGSPTLLDWKTGICRTVLYTHILSL